VRNLNYLVFAGFLDIRDKTYYQYKLALEDLFSWFKKQIIIQSSGISLLFKEKYEVEEFLKES